MNNQPQLMQALHVVSTTNGKTELKRVEVPQVEKFTTHGFKNAPGEFRAFENMEAVRAAAARSAACLD